MENAATSLPNPTYSQSKALIFLTSNSEHVYRDSMTCMFAAVCWF